MVGGTVILLARRRAPTVPFGPVQPCVAASSRRRSWTFQLERRMLDVEVVREALAQMVEHRRGFGAGVEDDAPTRR